MVRPTPAARLVKLVQSKTQKKHRQPRFHPLDMVDRGPGQNFFLRIDAKMQPPRAPQSARNGVWPDGLVAVVAKAASADGGPFPKHLRPVPYRVMH